MGEQFLSPAEVAELLQVKKNTVYEMVKRGEFQAVKLGKQIRISQKDVYRRMGIEKKPEEAESIIICGQDLLLDALCTLYNSTNTVKTRAYRSSMGSYNGLYEMYNHANYVATCHLWDAESDKYNLPYIVRMLPGENVVVVHLLKRWQGFYVKKGNPKGITGFSDLCRKDIRMVNREKGSGIRVFIDEMCRYHKISTLELNGYDEIASSHLMAATLVQRGSADVAIGNEKTCRQIEGLSFIPLKEESYDMVFRKEDLQKKEYRKLLEIIRSDEFMKEAKAIEGYNTEGMGTILLE